MVVGTDPNVVVNVVEVVVEVVEDVVVVGGVVVVVVATCTTGSAASRIELPPEDGCVTTTGECEGTVVAEDGGPDRLVVCTDISCGV